jgi:NADPH:quinone reductase-like Zn-dependent oxidoreductase
VIAQALAAVRAPVLLVHGAEDTPTRAPGRCPSASAPDRRTADLIYEVVGGATGADAVRTLAPGGRIAMVGSASGAPVALDPIDVILRD